MFWAYASMIALAMTGMILMFVVLLQRGRGGGLAGAFGGMGGQSAFGTKAGDVFTRITVVIAVIWVILAGASGFALRAGAEARGKEYGPEKPTLTSPPGERTDKEQSAPAKSQPGPAGQRQPAKTSGEAPAAPAAPKTGSAGDSRSPAEGAP